MNDIDAAVRTATYLDIVHRMIAERRAVARLSPDDVFSNGAWNIMLQLYESVWLERAISESSLTTASAVPHTTARRYISYLERADLLTRHCDDGAVTLSRAGFTQVSDYLRDIAQTWGVVVSAMPAPSGFG